jgi:uncharacterized membrane protein YuzA (DUF378 family)
LGGDKQTKNWVYSVVGIDIVVYHVIGIYGINQVMIFFSENEEFGLFRYWRLRNKAHY